MERTHLVLDAIISISSPLFSNKREGMEEKMVGRSQRWMGVCYSV